MSYITTNRKSGFIRRSGSMRRQTQWGGVALTTTTITGTGVALLASLSTVAKALRPFTIVRTHMHLSLQSDQVAASEDQIAVYGECIVSDQAVAIGVTAVPTPFTDIDSDLWYLWVTLQNSLLVVSASGNSTNFNYQREVDSKAMRKVEEGQDAITVLEAPGVSDGFTFTAIGRQLIKLH